jgi:hypothetical protein
MPHCRILGENLCVALAAETVGSFKDRDLGVASILQTLCEVYASRPCTYAFLLLLCNQSCALSRLPQTRHDTQASKKGLHFLDCDIHEKLYSAPRCLRPCVKRFLKRQLSCPHC